VTLLQDLVHRDVKPSNILLASPQGPTWLSDLGLAAAARHLPGFVKGLDLAYVPPEYIIQQQQQQGQGSGGSSSSSAGGGGGWQVFDDLPALAELTTTAADMYQLVSLIRVLMQTLTAAAAAAA
jgi:serine/threonine protein kinase